MRLFLCPWEFSDHLRGTDGHSHPAPAFALPVIRKWESCHRCCLCPPSPPLSHPVACHAPQSGSYSEGQPVTQTPFPGGACIPTLGWANKVTPLLWLNHLFTDSTYVLGTGLVAKNNSCVMERKFTFVGISQSDLVAYPFSVLLGHCFTYTLTVIGHLSTSHFLQDRHLSFIIAPWSLAKSPGLWVFNHSFYIHSSNAWVRATQLATGYRCPFIRKINVTNTPSGATTNSTSSGLSLNLASEKLSHTFLSHFSLHSTSI